MNNLGEFSSVGLDGKLEKCKIIGTFNKNNNLYIVYVDEEDKIQASRCVLEGTSLKLENDLTDAEYDLVDEYLSNN